MKDEKDPSGHSSTLCPVNYDKAGQIYDKELYQHLVCQIPKGASLTCLMDCCHSGELIMYERLVTGGTVYTCCILTINIVS